MKTVVALGVAIFACLHGLESVTALKAVCPTLDDTEQFQGLTKYLEGSAKTRPVPLSGTVACIDLPLLEAYPKNNSDASAIFGPMEKIISKTNAYPCMAAGGKIRGVDTYVAELMVEYQCKKEVTIKGLDVCADTKHSYNCLRDTHVGGHSKRIGTALDGRGIYGPNIATLDGVGRAAPDLDACGGRFGVNPDSEGQIVYYYMLRDQRPFTIGCFGNGIKKATLDDCRKAYPLTCGIGFIDVTTVYGTDVYDTDCPCFDLHGSNLPESMKTSPRPRYLLPDGWTTLEPTKSPTMSPTGEPTAETPSPTALPTPCEVCTDEPSPFHKNEGLKCSTSAETAELCRKKQFTDQGYCQMTCFEKSLEKIYYTYQGPSCCPRAQTYSPTPAPPTPAPNYCVQCDDIGTRVMIKKEVACDAYMDTFFPVVEENAWEIFCENNRKWRENKICRQSCYNKGVGYTKDDGYVEVCCGSTNEAPVE